MANYKAWNKGKRLTLKQKQKLSFRKKDSEVFIVNSKHPRHRVKERIINENLLIYECSICGIKEWLGKKLSLILDHINGINNDNRLENLRFVCHNCDSLLPTYKSKNIKYKQQTKGK